MYGAWSSLLSPWRKQHYGICEGNRCFRNVNSNSIIFKILRLNSWVSLFVPHMEHTTRRRMVCKHPFEIYNKWTEMGLGKFHHGTRVIWSTRECGFMYKTVTLSNRNDAQLTTFKPNNSLTRSYGIKNFVCIMVSLAPFI